MFVVCILQDFELEPVNFPVPVTILKDKMIGYLPVYATREDALSEFPNTRLMEIKKIKEV